MIKLIHTFKPIFSTLWFLLIDIFFPKRCIGCKKEGMFLCAKCAKNIERVKTPTCFYCGKITKDAKTCPACRDREKSVLSGILVAAEYESGPLKELVHGLKYSGLTELADPLGELLVQRLIVWLPQDCKDVVVVPVPLHKKRERTRGFNQSELLARYVSKRLGLPGGAALTRVKNTDRQVGHSGAFRRSNLSGAFKVEDIDLIKNKTVVLIDDVATTGSTLNECAKALKSVGVKKVWSLVVVRG